MKRIDISRLQKNKGIHFKISFIIALSMTIMAFNYTVYDYEQVVELEGPIYVDPDVEVIRTPSQEKPTPPPPKLDFVQRIEEVEETDLVEAQPKPKEIPLEIPADVAVLVAAPPVSKPAPPKPKPKPVVFEEEIDAGKLYTIVEDMPEFGDCGTSKNKNERKQISQKNLLQFIYKKIKYPRIALENGIQGRVFVRFIVNKEGVVEDAEILKEPGGGLGKEVLRVIDLMPKWKPGKQGLHPVKVQYTLPVEFKPI